MTRIIFMFIFLFFLAGCSAQHQGIKGKVVWVEGNQMPAPDTKRPQPAGIQRDIYIYQLTPVSKAKQSGTFYSEVQTPLVQVVKSRQDGSFAVTLPPGDYSIFTKENEGLFTNILDGSGNLNPVKVKPGEFSTMTIKIDYSAAY
jgi:hypothetical protein